MCNTEVLNNVLNEVNFVVHTKVKSPGLIHISVTHPFFSGAPILHAVVVWTLFHDFHRLYVPLRYGMEGCVHTRIFIYYLWFILFLNNHNRLQIPFCLWACLGIHVIVVNILASNSLWCSIMLNCRDQTKPLLPCIFKYHIMGVVVVPTDCGLSII